MYKVCMLFFCLAIYSPAISQCKNTVDVNKSSKVVNSVKTGILDVKVASGGAFTCSLKAEEGSGPVQLQKKEGRGNATVHFTGLDTNKIYMVEVEFLGEDNARCKKLQKSQIVIE